MPSPFRRFAWLPALGLMLAATDACPRAAPTRSLSEAGPVAQTSAAPDLPAADVVRLTDEARALLGETKLARTRAASLPGAFPFAATADSAHSYDATHYRLDVTPSRTSNLISGTMTMDLRVVDPAITVVDLFDEALNVTQVRVNGAVRSVTVAGGKLLIPICQGTDCPPHGAGDSLEVAVDYSASTPDIGFYYYARNSYTLAEPYDGRYWWPSYDLPNDKATLDIFATVPDTNVCVSNGVLVSVSAGAPGSHVYHWRETHPIATYLVAVTAGNYWQWTQTSGSLPILENVFPEDSSKAKFDFANVPAMITTFAARWGPYPFDKYGMVAVTPFSAGGMEHQSMTTINRSWVRGDRALETGIAHELAHQWWGDMVTLVDFRNIWLNEGFASYGECEWEEDFYGSAAYDSYVQAQMSSALNSDNNLRYALYDPPPANLFGNTIYKKGSLVLHMLRRVLGDAAFFAGMQLYGARFRYGNASTADFERAMEDASGQPLAWFFDEWVFDKGLPTYNWGWQARSGNPGQSTLGIQIRQVQTSAPLIRMPIELGVQRAGLPETTLTFLNHAAALENFALTVNGAVTNVLFDPRNSIYKRVQQITVGAPAMIPDAWLSVALAIQPNPARWSSRMRVRLSRVSKQRIELTIYDSSGRMLRRLGASPPGVTAADFDWDLRDRAGRRVQPGIYFARAGVGANHDERPIIVIE